MAFGTNGGDCHWPKRAAMQEERQATDLQDRWPWRSLAARHGPDLPSEPPGRRFHWAGEKGTLMQCTHNVASVPPGEVPEDQ
jgi:hypothetical protein